MLKYLGKPLRNIILDRAKIRWIALFCSNSSSATMREPWVCVNRNYTLSSRNRFDRVPSHVRRTLDTVVSLLARNIITSVNTDITRNGGWRIFGIISNFILSRNRHIFIIVPPHRDRPKLPTIHPLNNPPSLRIEGSTLVIVNKYRGLGKVWFCLCMRFCVRLSRFWGIFVPRGCNAEYQYIICVMTLVWPKNCCIKKLF